MQGTKCTECTCSFDRLACCWQLAHRLDCLTASLMFHCHALCLFFKSRFNLWIFLGQSRFNSLLEPWCQDLHGPGRIQSALVGGCWGPVPCLPSWLSQISCDVEIWLAICGLYCMGPISYSTYAVHLRVNWFRVSQTQSKRLQGDPKGSCEAPESFRLVDGARHLKHLSKGQHERLNE